ncbi:MAG: hypothetical protein CMB80_27755 [Flammeovirgaceae bacterium]|nr:hypothetical protein [Flammeovirgaceae bacterium]MBE62018.1 hypothetical protein [Flammeovirgaceae bacterium]HCX20867.1 hypothetical protein [Cytophagales bacterium]|tara:strand:- start:489 stop:1370 length:882 start_codon:yes stop_codon:yes gene_type:complete
MSEKNIELYKKRDFGQKINITIEYIRYNFGPLMKMILLIAIPMGILSSLTLGNYFSKLGDFANPNSSDIERMGVLGQMGGTYMLMFGVSIITYSLLIATIYNYIKTKNEDPNPDYMEVLRSSFKYVPGLVGLMIIIGFASFIGFFIFILPGIYLSVVMSLSIPIYMFEQEGIGEALSKSFKLIKEKWWSTFGLIIITTIIAGVASYVFLIPTYALMFSEMFSNVEKMESGDPTAVFDIFTSWTTTIGMAVSMVGSYLCYSIPIVAMAFQYFNLSERIEGRGLKSQIEDFENLS